MPGQFGSAKARPVNIGRRVSGHLLLVLAFLVPHSAHHERSGHQI